MSTTTIIWSVFAIFVLIVFIIVYYNIVIKPEKIKQEKNSDLEKSLKKLTKIAKNKASEIAKITKGSK